MTRSTGVRLYRACIRCRQRKTRCDLKYANENEHRPCSKCSAEGFKCVIAGSNRGGDYSHFRRRRSGQSRQVVRASDASEQLSNSSGLPNEDPAESCQNHHISSGIQNPLEALQILAQMASSERSTGISACTDSFSLEKTELVRQGIVDIQSIEPLLQYYANNYHCYLPIVPNALLSRGYLDQWTDESFLLATVLTIATQDRQGLESLHARVLGYMERFLLRVVLGSRSVRHVGSVEGLLLLAEWVPHIGSGIGSSGDSHSSNELEQAETTEEDSLAWNLIGLAVRQAYLLHLERHSFRGEVRGESEMISSRKRLAWIFTYLADRQISIQMGQAFWCRGPGLSTRFTTHDYPSLRPQKAGQVDYALFVQAQVELTTIFGNIHDILYASKSRTVQLMLMGDYTKYLDDSAKALDMWKQSWSNVDIPVHLSGLLTVQFEYLRLYINAFAFQAVLYRSNKENAGQDHESKISYFSYSVMASPDGRHIYAAIDAAKGVLKELIDRLNPSEHLRFLPVRYYLYEIHASVFLFKAHTVGALSPGEYQTCFNLTRSFIFMLKDAAATSSHIASKYAKLLACLWFQGQPTPEANNKSFEIPNTELAQAAIAPNSPIVSSGEIPTDSQWTVREGAGAQFSLADVFPDAAELSFLDSVYLADCPDAYLTNLPFLRAEFPDLDDNGINQLLMSDI